MAMNPWLAEELVSGRRRELIQSAHAGRQSVEDADGYRAPGPARPLRWVTRHVGTMMITVGQRLAGPEPWADALDC
jgi:hypothetical protein